MSLTSNDQAGSLERIVYISAAQEEQNAESVGRILDVARSRNEAARITGLLIGGAGWWMQLIEGEAIEVEPVWQSILHDPRHSPVILVQRRPISQRAFADWSMEFKSAEDRNFATLVEQLTGGISDPQIREQMRAFSRTFIQGARPWGDVA